VFAGRFFYILYFQEPGVAEAELEANVRKTMRIMLYNISGDGPRGAGLASKPKDAKLLEGMQEPERLPSWLTDTDLDYFVAEFERTGFRGGLNRYRNMDRDWEELPQLAGVKVQQPALFIGGESDPVLRFTALDAMKEHVPNLRGTLLLPGCGHWVQQERPAEVNSALTDFLRSL
jgi:pimeloyl-ACP methyl ester carboxylesterase